jgi:hypothetical protein
MLTGALNPAGAKTTIHAIGQMPRDMTVAPLLSPATRNRKGIIMLYTIAIILLVLWLLGLVSSYTLGGFIHILLVVAIVMVLLRVISGNRTP